MHATDFLVPRWLRSPHLQTFGAAAPLFCPPRSHAGITTEQLRLPLSPAARPEAHHRLHGRAW